jgi:hypothetical protein
MPATTCAAWSTTSIGSAHSRTGLPFDAHSAEIVIFKDASERVLIASWTRMSGAVAAGGHLLLQ